MTLKSDIETLKPCPFCGGKAQFLENEIDFVSVVSVDCTGCGASYDCCTDTESEAAEMWNTRASLTDDRTLPELPDGWFYTGMYQSDIVDPNAEGWVFQVGKNLERVSGEGPTPRAAVLAAVAKIGEKK